MSTGFPCPKCGKLLLWQLEIAGQKAMCPFCKNLFVFPHSLHDRDNSSSMVQESTLNIMKTVGIVLTLLVVAGVIIAIIIAIVPTTREEVHWLWASHKDDSSSYESYLKTWPAGRHVTEAKSMWDERSWTDALTTRNISGFERYLKFHPEGKKVAEAKENIDSLHWEEVIENKSILGFENYIKLHAEGKHVEEAKQKIESLRWQEANAGNTFISIQKYLDMYPNGRYAREAKSKQAAFLTDDAPFLEAQKKGTLQAFTEFLKFFPGHNREADARAAMKDIEGRDIVDLLNEKKIEIETRGSGIQSVSVKLRRLVSYTLTVKIPVGTYFVSRNPSSQNMVTTAESRQMLRNNDWVSISISAACANRQRNIPRDSDSFTVQKSPRQDELAKLMPVLDKTGVPYNVGQAAVWIVTDNTDYDDLGILVSSLSGLPFGGTRQIREYEAARAMKICEEAGIDIKQKVIWRDKNRILRGLKDGDSLKIWLEQKK